MNNRGDFNIGDEIRNIVQDAVNNRDFNRLNRDIGNMVNGALDEARRSIDRSRHNHQNWNNNWNNDSRNNNTRNNNTRNNNTWNNDNRNNDASKNDAGSFDNRNNGTWNTKDSDRHNNKHNKGNYSANSANSVNRGYEQKITVPKSPRYTVSVGHAAGTLFTVFGTIGCVGFSIAAIVLAGIGYLIGGSIFNIIALGLVPCILASAILSVKGSGIRKRLKRFQRYIAQLQGRNYCLIKDLSAVTGRSNRYTVKDLQTMITIGMFPEGHIDDKKTCFMLNNESYQQYLNLQENMKVKDTLDETANPKDTLDAVIRKAIDDGRQFVQKIKNANIAIPGEAISRKLDRLEEVTGKIYDYVETHPEKYPEIKKFTEYFLPTTLKLLDAYKELDYQPVVGDNISTAKKEIEDTMDTINLAFENLLDGLFADVAMDISTDISVLQTMFAQEGLTEKNVRV